MAAIAPLLPERLRPPRRRIALLSRPFLVEKVRNGIDGQVVTVQAPGGYGKTELLAAVYEALAGEGARIGWVTAGPANDDPALILADIAAALGVGAAVAGAAATDEAARRLADAIAAAGERVVLFVDAVRPGSAAADGIAALCRAMGNDLRLVVASRGRPDLPLAGLRLRGLVAEIGPGQLAFGRGEVRRILHHRLPPGALDDVMLRTLGWPAAVHLYAEAADAAEREAVLAGTHPSVRECIDDVMAELAPELQATLAAAAILDAFPVELAGLLAQTSVPACSRLDDLAPLVARAEPAAQGWLRLHPLLRATLRDALAAGGRIEALHARAGAWFAARGFVEQAVTHAALGQDFALATDTIRAAGGVNLFIRAGHTVLDRVVRALPSSVVAASPGLRLCHVLVLAKRGRVAAARALLERVKADERTGGTIGAGVIDHIEGLVDIYEDCPFDDAHMARLGAALAGFGPADTWERGWLLNHLAIAHTRRGELEAARATASGALACYRDEGTAYGQIFMLVHQSLVAVLRGEMVPALEAGRAAQDLVARTQWSDVNLKAIANIPLAEVHYHQGNLALAERLMGDACDPLCRGEGWVDLYVRMFGVLARCRLRSCGIDAALLTIGAAEEVAGERCLPRLAIAAQILRCGIFIRAGMVESALHGLCELEAVRADMTWRERSDFELATASARLRSGDPDAAAALSRRLAAEAGAAGHGQHQLAALVLLTEAAWEAGDPTLARDALSTAIALARPHETVQVFHDAGASLGNATRAIVRRFGLASFSKDAVEYLGRIVGPPGDSDRDMRGEMFSARELEVLRHLVDGLSNKEIARAIAVSEATVKFHVRNVYQKLGVSRRTLAVTVAKQLNVLPS